VQELRGLVPDELVRPQLDRPGRGGDDACKRLGAALTGPARERPLEQRVRGGLMLARSGGRVGEQAPRGERLAPVTGERRAFGRAQRGRLR
jgi:hypothetical protein